MPTEVKIEKQFTKLVSVFYPTVEELNAKLNQRWFRIYSRRGKDRAFELIHERILDCMPYLLAGECLLLVRGK